MTIPFKREDDNPVIERSYRARSDTVAYARPGGAAMIRLEAGQVVLGRDAYVAGWVAWIEDDVIGYICLDDLELVP